MKKFLYRTCLLLIPIILLAYPLDLMLSGLLKQSHASPGEFEVMNDIYQGEAGCDIAIYGSSRAWVHIDPQVMQDSLNLSAYNFGVDGHNFWIQYLRHLEYRKHNRKPKKIIVSVDIFSLQKRADLYDPDQFLPYMLWNENITEYTSSFVGYKTADYYLPLVRYTGKSNALNSCLRIFLKGSGSTNFRTRGYAGMEREWNSDFDKAKANMDQYEMVLSKESIALFKSFIRECQENDIEVILVYTPEYIEGQQFVANRSEVIDLYREVSKANNLLFFDYSNDALCLDKYNFYNANHLNKAASAVFSKKFAHELKTRSGTALKWE